MSKDNGKKSIDMDFSKFSHVKTDDKTTTLKHYQGHQIVLVHKALSKDNRAALKAMADKAQAKAEAKGDGKPSTPEMLAKGGKVMTNIKTNDTSKGVDLANKTRKEGDASPNGITIENPGKPESKDYGKITGPGGQKPQVFAEGGIPEALDPNATPMQLPPQPVDTKLPDFSPEGVAQATATAEPGAVFNRTKELYPWMTGKDIVANMDKTQDAGHQSVMADQAATLKQNTAASDLISAKQARGIPLTPEEQATMASGSQGAAPVQPGAMQPDPGLAAAANQLQQGTAGQGASGGLNDIEGMMRHGYNTQMAGIYGQAKAQGDLGQQQAAILDQQVKAQTEAKAAYDQHYNELEQERKGFIQDIQDGHIDPNKYWTGDKDGNGSHSKIAAGIGMILAGFNPTTSPNAAINYLKFQMEQNLQAQTKNLDSKQNLLSANLRQFGNLKDATEMTRLMQNDMLAHQLSAAAATAQTPMAKAAAMQAAGALQQESAPKFQQFAMRRAMMGLANNPNQDPSNTAAAEQMIAYARMTNPEMAKEMESRLVPGVGMAKLPIPQDARTEIIGKQNFNQMAQHYVDFVNKHSGSLNPKAITEGTAMAAELQGAYRSAVKGGVFKEGEQKFIEQLIPSDPTQFAASIRTLPKLQTLIQSNNSQLNQLKSGYGLPTAQQQPTAHPNEGKIAVNAATGARMQMVNGKWKSVK